MYRVNSQGCSEDKAGVDKSRARVRAIGLKSHVPSLATLGRIFWRNADLGTFAKFSRGNSRTFNQVPKICRTKCTHRHPQSLAAFDRIHWLHFAPSWWFGFLSVNPNGQIQIQRETGMGQFQNSGKLGSKISKVVTTVTNRLIPMRKHHPVVTKTPRKRAGT